jgi:hypothetical protein
LERAAEKRGSLAAKSLGGRRLNLRYVFLALVLLTTSTYAQGGIATQPQFTEVQPCTLAEHPERYSGQFVRVEAEIVNPRATQLRVDQCSKGERIFVDFPDGSDVQPKPKFALIRDEQFNRLFNSISVLLPRPGYSTSVSLFATDPVLMH